MAGGQVGVSKAPCAQDALQTNKIQISVGWTYALVFSRDLHRWFLVSRGEKMGEQLSKKNWDKSEWLEAVSESRL